MTIDTSGKWWKGSAPEDVGEYLQALSAGTLEHAGVDEAFRA